MELGSDASLKDHTGPASCLLSLSHTRTCQEGRWEDLQALLSAPWGSSPHRNKCWLHGSRGGSTEVERGRRRGARGHHEGHPPSHTRSLVGAALQLSQEQEKEAHLTPPDSSRKGRQLLTGPSLPA